MNKSTGVFTNRKHIELPEGGKEPIERIVTAYGFQSRQALCRHLNVSQSTMANRISRGNFPADWVIICAMETGASLEWLTYGVGSMLDETKPAKPIQLKHTIITNGMRESEALSDYDTKLIPQELAEPSLVTYEKKTYLVDAFQGEVSDGLWLIKIDAFTSVRELYRLPGGKIRVENGKASFECSADDIEVLGKVISVTQYV